MSAPLTGFEPNIVSADDGAVVQTIRDALHALEEARHDDAIRACEQALAARPLCAEAIYILGLTSFELEAPSQAIKLLEKAHELGPDVCEYAEALAAINATLGAIQDSLYFAKMSAATQPHPVFRNLLPARFGSFFVNLDNAEPDLYHRRATEAFALGNHEEALRCCEVQLDLKPDDTQCLRLLGHTARLGGLTERAAAAFHTVLHSDDLQPTDLSGLGQALSAAGRHAEAAACHAAAAAYAPDDALLQSRGLADLGRDPDVDTHEFEQAHLHWQQRHWARIEPRDLDRNKDRDPDRPLRVGYMFGSYLNLPVMRSLEPVLRHHERGKFQAYCYAEGRRTDAQSERLASLADRWTDLAHIDDETAWQILRGDEIDIVVDLVGHGDGGRPLVLARRPAPLALSWLGQSHTPAMSWIDYALSDPAAWPAERGDTAWGTKLWRLPQAAIPYQTPAIIPAPDPPPSLQSAQPTFGVQCDLASISASTAALWAVAIRSTPGAGLIICNRNNLDQAAVDRCVEYFSNMGLRQSVEIVNAADNFATEFEFYQHIDLALDPAPEGDLAETCQALCMGVPVLVLRGERPNLSAAALAAAGHSEWIADSLDDLARTAAELLHDSARLAELRAGLRAAVAVSGLGDAEGFTRDLESAYRDMWRAWCAG